ncbi:hypothetical protein BU17DRAFT_62641 [Hysterangium stoloniferum]|nr:hypothetical protein BU17DRAFT_62641 [Hysterangium stoloniferum]
MRTWRSLSNTPGDGSEEPLIGDEAREALLDKEDAGAVGMILEEDRSKEDVVEVVMENGFRFGVQLRARWVLDDKDYQKASALELSSASYHELGSIFLRRWLGKSTLSFSVGQGWEALAQIAAATTLNSHRNSRFFASSFLPECSSKY